MRQLSNVHTHSTWCDGNDTPREMAEAALALGFTGLGFSSHSPAPFDPRCSGVADEAAYIADIAALRREYEGKLDILCGIEQDLYGPVADIAQYDYVIGAVHYLPPVDGEYLNVVDGTSEELRAAIGTYYDGDAIAMLRDYYANVVENVRRFRPAIVAHYDLPTKFNAGNALFDEEGAAYRKVALEAMDAVLDILRDYGGMVEVNTGAMARRYRAVPYPAAFLLRHVAQRGGRAIITSDCHDKTKLSSGYSLSLGLLRGSGFKAMAVLQNGAFRDVSI